MNQTHLKWITQALSKARAEKIKISWSDYYPMCPRCGSWEAERHRGEPWPYCPMCGQKLRDIKAKKKEVLPERWCSVLMEKFKKRE